MALITTAKTTKTTRELTEPAAHWAAFGLQDLRRIIGVVSTQKASRGYTLIEIIVVIAIIGLIFVLVFIAVASSQQAQRDAARKDAVNRMAADIKLEAGDNYGVFPTCSGSPCTPPPSGWTSPNTVALTITSGSPSVSAIQWIMPSSTPWTPPTNCSGPTQAYGAVQVALEAGGTYCVAY